MPFTKVAPAGIGTEPGDGYRIGDSFLHATGLSLGSGTTISHSGSASFSGIVTASSFVGSGSGLTGVASTDHINSSTNAVLSGIVTAGTLNVSGNATVTGTLGVGGTLTYEDVTNIDSVGVITARSGINLTGGVINSAGNINCTSGRFQRGSSTVQDGDAIAGGININGTDMDASVIMSVFGNDGDFTRISGSKSRNASVGSHTIVQNNDVLLSLKGFGSDGTNFEEAAQIEMQVDGSPGNDDMPGRIVFKTTADGASSPTERLRIDSSGRVGVNQSTFATADTMFSVSETTGHCEIGIISKNDSGVVINMGDPDSYNQGRIKYDNSDNSLTFRTSATDRLRITSDGYVTKPSQPRALVKIYSTTTLSNAKITNWASPIYNVGSLWDATNSRFVAPVAGLYLIGGNFRIGAPGHIRVVKFNIQAYNTSNQVMAIYGGGVGGTHNYDDGSGGYDHPYVSFTNAIYLQANQYLELHCSETAVQHTSYIQVSNEQSAMWCVLLQ